MKSNCFVLYTKTVHVQRLWICVVVVLFLALFGFFSKTMINKTAYSSQRPVFCLLLSLTAGSRSSWVETIVRTHVGKRSRKSLKEK